MSAAKHSPFPGRAFDFHEATWLCGAELRGLMTYEVLKKANHRQTTSLLRKTTHLDESSSNEEVSHTEA
jgi:hypothetical protein